MTCDTWDDHDPASALRPGRGPRGEAAPGRGLGAHARRHHAARVRRALHRGLGKLAEDIISYLTFIEVLQIYILYISLRKTEHRAHFPADPRTKKKPFKLDGPLPNLDICTLDAMATDTM